MRVCNIISVNYLIIHAITCAGTRLHRKKKVREFPVLSRDVTTKLSLGGNNDVISELFLPRGSLVSDIPAGDGKLVNLFLRCNGSIPFQTAQKSLDFQGPTPSHALALALALVMDLPASKPLRTRRIKHRSIYS